MNKMEERKGVDYRRIWRMLWPSIKHHWRFYPPLLIVAILTAAVTIFEPYIYGAIIDSLVASVEIGHGVREGFDSIRIFLIAWGGLILVQTGFGALYTYFFLSFNNAHLGHLTQRWFERALRLDVERFREERAGELLNKFDNTWHAGWGLMQLIIRNVIPSCFTFIGVIGLGLFLDARLLVVSLIPIPIVIGVGFFNLRISERDQNFVHKFWEKMTGHVGDSFMNIASLKSYVGESRAVRAFAGIYRFASKHQRAVNLKWVAAEAGFGGVYIAGRLLIFLVGAWFVLEGSTTLGTMITFLGLAGFLFSSVEQIMQALPEFSRATVRLHRAADYWFEIPDIQDRKGAKGVKIGPGHLVVDDLSFSYQSGKPVLRDVSFDVPAGKMLALVGESGAGKSTLAQMMMRFYDPIEGAIQIDGVDLRDIKLASLRKQIGFVMQENMLFHSSILQNIRYAKPGASLAVVKKAARRAQAHSFIKDLPKGYDTVVGERGVKLSGGQKQRIALARVFLADPPILVLDEATSALDSKTEHELQVALRAVMKDRTTLVIAHRLSTVMAADIIIVMHKGRVVDQGVHADLIKRGGLYKEYWEIQAGGYV